MGYNLATEARLQAMKDITDELAKEGRVYIKTSLKALNEFDADALDFYPTYSKFLARGKDGHYTKQVRRMYIR